MGQDGVAFLTRQGVDVAVAAGDLRVDGDEAPAHDTSSGPGHETEDPPGRVQMEHAGESTPSAEPLAVRRRGKEGR